MDFRTSADCSQSDYNFAEPFIGSREETTAPANRNQAVLDAALVYSEIGLPVLPVHGLWPDDRDFEPWCTCNKGEACRDPGKHPACGHGVHNATSNEERIRNWFGHRPRRTHPERNIGINTGRSLPRGGYLMVLDVDVKAPTADRAAIDGNVTLASLAARHGPLPATLEARTGGGGRHLFFQASSRVPNSNGRLGPGLDVRCKGGYVVAAPSRHVSGAAYRWASGNLPTLAEIKDCPVWLCELAERPTAPDQTPTPRATGGAPRVPGVRVLKGERNDTLFRYGCGQRAQGMTDAEILPALVDFNRRCEPPLSDARVASTAKSIQRYPVGGAVRRAPGKTSGPVPVERWPEALHVWRGCKHLGTGYTIAMLLEKVAHIPRADQTASHMKRMGAVLRGARWAKARRQVDGIPAPRWTPPGW